ncbi:hypothetical protein ABVK25_001115 [Lepraria finkii]|uniref:Uncharacterized protein n=1 Tax=Lepraria finkii TaxID=1340010 RepID=A0ABR4BKQ3_9LECA
MCYIDEQICAGCGHTQNQAVRTPYSSTGWSIPVACSGKNVVRTSQYHGMEWCIYCYHKRLTDIEKRFVNKPEQKKKELEKLRLEWEGYQMKL